MKEEVIGYSKVREEQILSHYGTMVIEYAEQLEQPVCRCGWIT